jgi:hypothetical protein
MERWESEPLWDTLDRLQPPPPVAITAADTLGVVVRERSRLPRLAATNFKGLDRIKSLMALGQVGVVIRS